MSNTSLFQKPPPRADIEDALERKLGTMIEPKLLAIAPGIHLNSITFWCCAEGHLSRGCKFLLKTTSIRLEIFILQHF